MERLYDPQRGSISFGHVALPEVDHKYLHSQVGGGSETDIPFPSQTGFRFITDTPIHTTPPKKNRNSNHVFLVLKKV